jgi:hypothetical protein
MRRRRRLVQTLGQKAKQLLFLLRRQRVGGSFNVGKALHDEEDNTAVPPQTSKCQ